MNITNPAYEIERLLRFGIKCGMLEKWDVVPVRNALMELLLVSEPYEGEFLEPEGDSPVDILNNILDYAWETGIMAENTITYRDLLDTKIMGLMMPRQSEVIRKFLSVKKEQSIEKATESYYTLSKVSNYIRTDRIAKNLYWQTSTQYGDIEITVNLSKPEKDPKAIAAARSLKQSNYPKCLLCLENVGYQGRLNHPARQNHRVIPVELEKEQWFLQYSPYVYYNEHCIIFSENHVPMTVSEKSFARLLSFVEQFPHYFVGSNADLPIVGGSILSHEHFQGGRHSFPMEKAAAEEIFINDEFPGVKAGIVNWPMSVIRLSGRDKNELTRAAVHFLNKWRGYSDLQAEVIAYTEKDGVRTPHNTITPIARINSSQEFELDLVLRNNRTSKEHPDGIFHPHQELHHIKKENIGLIEVMGLAVLPGRLDEEIKAIQPLLTGEKVINDSEIASNDLLNKHLRWIKVMAGKYGVNNQKAATEEILRKEIGSIFLKVLEDAGVFKRNDQGRCSFFRFMNHTAFKITGI